MGWLQGPRAAGAIVLMALACGDRSWLGAGLRESVNPVADASLDDAGEDATTQAEPEGGEVAIEEPGEGDATRDATGDVTVEHRVDATAEAGQPPDARTCDYGAVVSDVFGATVFFAGGASLPGGRYRVTYVDGCMKYSANQDWAVNAYGPGQGPDTYWLVDGHRRDVVVPPGTVGFLAGAGAYASFYDCVAANEALPPVEFTFAGGMLGVWLEDSPYTDNVPGLSGRSPTWRLACVP